MRETFRCTSVTVTLAMGIAAPLWSVIGPRDTPFGCLAKRVKRTQEAATSQPATQY